MRYRAKKLAALIPFLFILGIGIGIAASASQPMASCPDGSSSADGSCSAIDDDGTGTGTGESTEPLLRSRGIMAAEREFASWPGEVARRTLFLRTDLPDSDDRRFRMDYEPSSGLIRVFDPDHPGENANDEFFDPADVIGVDLEVDLPGREGMADENGEMQAGTLRQIIDPLSGKPAFLQVVPEEDASPNDAFLNVHHYPRKVESAGLFSWCKTKKSPDHEEQLGPRAPKHLRWKVAPSETNHEGNAYADARSLVLSLRRLAGLQRNFPDFNASNDTPGIPPSGEPAPPRKYLVIVNPFSGKKTGRNAYEETIRVMLDQAGVEHEVLFTTHAGHALGRASKKDSTVLKGETKDAKPSALKWKNATQIDDETKDLMEYDAVIAVGGDGILWEIFQGIQSRENAGKDVLDKLKFGIIGTGTSNGLAKSILHAADEDYYGVLESTFLICKGQISRLDLSRHQLLERRESYTGFLTFSWGLIADVDIESEKVRFLGSLRTDIWAVWRMVNLRTYRAKFSYLPPPRDGSKEVIMPGPEDPVPDDWVTIEDDFLVFWSSQVSHASYDILSSPRSKLDDGVFQVLIVRASCSRLNLVRMFLEMESGGHANRDECEYYECVAYRLEPITPGSYNDLDGEVIGPGPIQAQVLPGAAQFFAGPPS